MQRFLGLLLLLLIVVLGSVASVGSVMASESGLPVSSATVVSGLSSGDLFFNISGVYVNGSVFRVLGAFPMFNLIDYNNSTIYNINYYIIMDLYFDLDYNYATSTLPEEIQVGNITLEGTDENLQLVYAGLYTYTNSSAGFQNGYFTQIYVRGPPPFITQNFTFTIHKNYLDLGLNWTNLKYYYNYRYRVPYFIGDLHRIYVIEGPKIFNTSVITGTLGYMPTVITYFRLEDGINNSNKTNTLTIPYATINFTGSTSDWPQDSLAYTDIPENLASILPVADAQAIYLAADNNWLYVGIKRAGPTQGYLNGIYSYDIVIPLNTTGGSQYDTIIEAKFGVAYSQPTATITLYSNNTSPVYSFTSSDYNTRGQMLEFRIPLSMFTNGFGAGSNTTVFPSNYTIEGIDYLMDNSTSPAVYDVAVNETDNTSLCLGEYMVNKTLITPGVNVTYAFDGMSIEIPVVSDNITMYIGSMGSPVFNGTVSNPPSRFDHVYSYYFSVNNTTRVKWPVKLGLKLPVQADKVIVYTYNKTLGEYIPLPQANMTYYKDNSTIMIEMGSALYLAGDPAFIVYTVNSTVSTVPQIIGGMLVYGSPGNGNGLFGVLFVGVLCLLSNIILYSKIYNKRK